MQTLYSYKYDILNSKGKIYNLKYFEDYLFQQTKKGNINFPKNIVKTGFNIIIVDDDFDNFCKILIHVVGYFENRKRVNIIVKQLKPINP